MFKYHVVFTGQRMGRTFTGSTESETNKPIKSIHDIRKVEQAIKNDEKADWVTITFWKGFD